MGGKVAQKEGPSSLQDLILCQGHLDTMKGDISHLLRAAG